MRISDWSSDVCSSDLAGPNRRSDQRGRRMAVKRISTRSKQPEPVQEPRSEPPLSRERIAAAAVELLDAQGVGGVTMRRLADRLGSGLMSLYWHVNNTEDVFALALDSLPAYRKPPQLAESQDLRGEDIRCL